MKVKFIVSLVFSFFSTTVFFQSIKVNVRSQFTPKTCIKNNPKITIAVTPFKLFNGVTRNYNSHWRIISISNTPLYQPSIIYFSIKTQLNNYLLS